MQTVEQIIEALKAISLSNRWVRFPHKVKEYYEVEKRQMRAIISLLSQQAAEINDLKRWKAEALAVMPDMQRLLKEQQEPASISKGMAEAELIHAGKMEGKTFEQFLDELEEQE
jgi:hypothetical protein